jgi:hypothetical protein
MESIGESQMRKLDKGMLFAIGLMAVAFLINTGSAFASSVEIRIINTAGGGDTGWIVCPTSSCSFVGAVGNYSVASDIATMSTINNPFLDLSYSARTSVANAGTIIFEAIADGYTVGNPTTFVQGNGNSTLGDMIQFATFGGNTNTLCAAGINVCSASSNGAALGSVGPLTIGQSAAFNVGAAGAGNTVNPYSLGIQVTLNGPTSAGAASGDIALSTPEPGSLTLLGGGLLALVGGLRRKMHKA